MIQITEILILSSTFKSFRSTDIDYFKSKPSELPKITLLVDHGYHPDKLMIAKEQIYPQIMTKIQFELSAKPSKGEKEAQGLSGFVPLVARWGKRTVKCLGGAM